MKIISDDCKKLVKFVREYYKWVINVCESGEFSVNREIEGVEVSLYHYAIFINGHVKEWEDDFNFVESIYLYREQSKLRKFKIEEYKLRDFILKERKFAIKKLINVIDKVENNNANNK